MSLDRIGSPYGDWHVPYEGLAKLPDSPILRRMCEEIQAAMRRDGAIMSPVIPVEESARQLAVQATLRHISEMTPQSLLADVRQYRGESGSFKLDMDSVDRIHIQMRDLIGLIANSRIAICSATEAEELYHSEALFEKSCEEAKPSDLVLLSQALERQKQC